MEDDKIKSYITKVGEKILAIRNEKGISQQELEYRSGINKPYIRQIEKGRTNPTLKTILILCDALEVSIEDILIH